MADLEAQIPQDIEHELDGRFRPDRLLHRQEEEQVDVGARRQRATAVAADGSNRDAACRRRVGRIEDLVEHEIMQHRDQLVLKPGDALGAEDAAAVAGKQFARLGAARNICLLEGGKQCLAHRLALLGVRRCDEVAFRPKRRDIENFGKGSFVSAHEVPRGVLSDWLRDPLFEQRSCRLPSDQGRTGTVQRFELLPAHRHALSRRAALYSLFHRRMHSKNGVPVTGRSVPSSARRARRAPRAASYRPG